jgi:hypothetical protein
MFTISLAALVHLVKSCGLRFGHHWYKRQGGGYGNPLYGAERCGSVFHTHPPEIMGIYDRISAAGKTGTWNKQQGAKGLMAPSASGIGMDLSACDLWI